MASRGRWIGATLLALGVGATALAVPPLVLSWAEEDADPPAAAPTTPAPAATTSTPRPTATPSVAPTTAAATSAPPVTTTKPPPRFTPRTIDAADPANDRYGIEITDCPTCESGRRVQYLGQGHALRVHVRDVPVAGKRTLTIVYTSGETRQLDVRVNGGRPRTLTLDGAGSWEIPVRTKLEIQLPAGDSEIMFLNPDDPAPDLDRVIVS